MLRYNTFNFLIRKETVWFAHGLYSKKEYTAHITYFRQHSLDIPQEFIVYDEDFHTLVLNLSEDLDALYANISRSNRQDIEHAKKEGVLISCFRDSEKGVKDFVHRHGEFNKAKGLGKAISKNDVIALKGNWSIYNAVLKGEWLVQHIHIYDGERMRAWVNGSNLNISLRKCLGYAGKAMFWQSICDAKNMGLKLFDFGGIVLDKDDPRYGITLYKKYFGGSLLTQRNTLVIPDPFIRNLYCRLRKRNCISHE